jgi:heat shock protein HslJ
MKKVKIILVVLLALIFIETKSQAKSLIKLKECTIQAGSFPDTSTWVLTKIHGSKSKQHAGNKLFIHINTTEKKISGYTSCNFIRGQVSVKDTAIAISAITLGKRECDAATSEMEVDFVQTIERAASWKVVEGILYLYDKGILIMEFKTATGK